MTAPPPDMRGGVVDVGPFAICECGHSAVEHYDGHDLCTWLLDDACDCHQYRAPDFEATNGNCRCSKGATCAYCLGLTGGKR